MADNVAGAVAGAVQLGAEYSAQVADADLHGVGDGALRLTRDVDGRPRQRQRRRRIDAARSEKGAEVRHARPVARLLIGQEDDVSDDGEEG